MTRHLIVTRVKIDCHNGDNMDYVVSRWLCWRHQIRVEGVCFLRNIWWASNKHDQQLCLPRGGLWVSGSDEETDGMFYRNTPSRDHVAVILWHFVQHNPPWTSVLSERKHTKAVSVRPRPIASNRFEIKSWWHTFLPSRIAGSWRHCCYELHP